MSPRWVVNEDAVEEAIDDLADGSGPNAVTTDIVQAWLKGDGYYVGDAGRALIREAVAGYRSLLGYTALVPVRERGSVELWAIATLAGYSAMALAAIVAIQRFAAMDTATITRLVEALR